LVRPNGKSRGPNQTPGERKYFILSYLKNRGDVWSNLNQIALGVPRSINRDRLKPELEECVERGLVIKNTEESVNPQAKNEYKITEKGILKLKAWTEFLKDPDMRSLTGFRHIEFG